jgi:hypothetical protein
MTDTIPPAAIKVLPVRETILETYRTVLGQPIVLLKAIVFPYLLSVAIGLGWFVIPYWEHWSLFVLSYCIDLTPYTFFGVAWHRLTLLGPDDGQPPLLPAPKRRHVLFFIFALVVTSIYVLPIWAILPPEEGRTISSRETGEVIVWISGVSFLLLITVGTYVLFPYLMVRLSFVFPAISVDENYRLRHSWRHTRKQGFRLLFLVIAAGLPGVLLIYGLGYSLDALFDFIPKSEELAWYSPGYIVYAILFFLVVPVLQFVPIALVVSAVSSAFRICTGWVP